MSAHKPRVLWLVKGLGRGGAEMLLVELARSWAAEGLRVDVAYVLPHKNALVEDLARAGVRVRCLGGGSLSWVRALRGLLRDETFDVIHTHSPVIGAAARTMVGRDSVVVHTEHNVWDRYRRPTRWANAATIQRNHRVWAVSEGVAASIRPWGRRRARPPVEVLLHGIRPDSIASGPAARAEGRRRLGLDPAAYVVGTVGNLTPKKDQDCLLRAFRLFRAGRPDARLVVVGTGPREQHLRTLASHLGIADAVTFTGIRDDVPELLAAFDQFAMSSLHEGLSIAVIEAMAAGLPVVATRVGGLPELVTEGREGFLVAAGDPLAMARAWERLAGDRRMRDLCSTAAALRAAEFDIRHAADRLAAAYRELADTGAKVRAGS